MGYASSARRTCIASRSGSLYTATERIPRSRHARMTRTAISPRFAMRTFSNGVPVTTRSERDVAVLAARVRVAFPRERAQRRDELRPRLVRLDDVVDVPARCRDVRVRETLDV